MTAKIQGLGYDIADARARVCQDIVLKAIANSSLSRNVTIKGGVVMRSMTGNIRRATQDMDVDFIRYSLSNESIDLFLDQINCFEGVKIVRIGNIEELSQQDYHGKRVFIKITDNFGNSIDSKIDLGVHKHLEIEQEEYCFDIAFDDEGASLLINSREQMFAEKLRSLLKFGVFSTRYKDIYDMYYHCDMVDFDKLKKCCDTYIFNDSGMRENDMMDVVKRVKSVFGNVAYKNRVDKSDKRWIDDDIEDIFEKIINFLKELY
ncbi:MAG: nucleotidyl transferase AbiEii/AbiGii toxin family protein [Tyzzerella sp.]|nr:nucleotidyl transferase AbiEii/AbiGii toxin family protein [Tyzzerella sp.]